MLGETSLHCCFIVPTRNRHRDIRALLGNLSDQSIRPNQVVIVDASDTAQPELVQEFPKLEISYRVYEGAPSAAAQRNAGLEHIDASMDLIGFVDDDILFEKQALENMLQFWNHASHEVCGTAFNLIETGADAAKGRLKLSGLSDWLGLYRAGVGGVAPSGWHTRIGNVDKDTQVEWLTTSAVIWRREVLKDHRFDTFFQGYSYLEDLDFSYGIGRHCEMFIIADARFQHYHHHHSWTSERYLDFGRMEVRNRLFFVRKHGLSVMRCYLGLVIRLVQTLIEAATTRNPTLLSRAQGNLAGLCASLWPN